MLAMTSTFLAAVVFANLFEWRFRKPVEKAAMVLLEWLGRIRGLGALKTTPAVTAAE